MEQIDTDVFAILVSAISVVFVSMAAAIVKLYNDKQQAHSYVIARDIEDIKASNRIAEILQHLRDQLQANHDVVSIAVERVQSLEIDTVKLAEKIEHYASQDRHRT